MEQLTLIHRKNLSTLLEKQCELQQKQYSILRLLAVARKSLVGTLELSAFTVMVNCSTPDLSIHLTNSSYLTLKFVAPRVNCKKETYVDWVIRRALDNPNTYKDEDFFKLDPYSVNHHVVTAVTQIITPKQLPQHELKSPHQLSQWLLSVVQQENHEDFWNHVGKLNRYFLINPFSIEMPTYTDTTIGYIRELTKRCLLASSSEIRGRLQQYIIRLLVSCQSYIKEENIKLFEPVFLVHKLSKMASLQTILDNSFTVGSKPTFVRRLSPNMGDWIYSNGEYWVNMKILHWITKYMRVTFDEDVTDPDLKQMEIVLDHYEEIVW